MSSGVTRLSASPKASESASFALAPTRRSHPLSFENISSIGVRSGLDGHDDSARSGTWIGSSPDDVTYRN